MKVDPKEITKVFEELDNDLCRGTGFKPSGVKLLGMKAGEEPRVSFTFERCPNGCEENIEKLKELFSL